MGVRRHQVWKGEAARRPFAPGPGLVPPSLSPPSPLAGLGLRVPPTWAQVQGAQCPAWTALLICPPYRPSPPVSLPCQPPPAFPIARVRGA